MNEYQRNAGTGIKDEFNFEKWHQKNLEVNKSEDVKSYSHHAHTHHDKRRLSKELKQLLGQVDQRDQAKFLAQGK